MVVSDKIRLEALKVSMTQIIFDTIDQDRDYLKQWLPFVDMTREVADTEKFIRSLQNQPDKKKDEVWSIWYNQEFAGLIGFKDTDWINKKTEIGYWLASDMQGKGIIVQSAKKLIAYSFRKQKLNRVQIKVAVGNEKSSAIPKHLGFKFEGIERAGELLRQKYLDLEVYSLLKSDF